MEPLQNIWNNDKKPILNEELKAYVQNELTPEQQFAIETQFNENSDFELDAIEGLKSNSIKNLDVTTLELHKRIEKSLLHKKLKRKINDKYNINTITILTLLGLAIIGYIVIRMILKRTLIN